MAKVKWLWWKIERWLKITLNICLCILVAIITPIIVAAIYVGVPLRANSSGYNWSTETNFNVYYTIAGHEIPMPQDEMKILIISELRVSFFFNNPTYRNIDKLVNQSNPDLIILMGNNVGRMWNNNSNLQLLRHIDKYEIPWAAILGSRDGKGKANRNFIAKQLGNTTNGLFLYGPNEFGGTSGNYFINLRYNNQIVHTLYMMGGVRTEWYQWAMDNNPNAESTVFTNIAMHESNHEDYGYSDLVSSKDILNTGNPWFWKPRSKARGGTLFTVKPDGSTTMDHIYLVGAPR